MSRSTAETGRANVSVSVELGEIRLPFTGSETTLVRAPGTNHETRAGSDSRSHGRTAAATVVVPAVARPEATTPSGTVPRPGSGILRSFALPTATRVTGSAKRIVTGLPRLGRKSVVRIFATGVVTVTVRSTCRPTSQPIQLGRWISTLTVSRSPEARRSLGQSVPWRTTTGTGFRGGR